MKTKMMIAMMCFWAQISFAQTNEEKAIEKTKEAIQLMDNGNIEEALSLLDEAQKLDGGNIFIPYEKAIAHYLKKDYAHSIKILKKLKKHEDVNPQIYQLLGNSYSMNNDRKTAIETYEAGLEKYPNSGILYLERGNMEFFVENYDAALAYYETGIKVDPEFPSNYYWASKIYCSSTEEVWGVIYGELFMNLERNSKRTVEISKLLFDTYKSEIQFPEEDRMTISFSKNSVISLEDLNDPENLKLPFGVGIYETTLMLSVVDEKEINISSLNRIRTNFVKLYFENNHQEKYPNALFDYQKEVAANGHIEAYNHWILMQGDLAGFEHWLEHNEDKWNSFLEWFSENQIKLNAENSFHREQYK